MPRVKHFCATPGCGKRATRGCARCGADCCKKHGKMYHVELNDFPLTLPVALKEELQGYGATSNQPGVVPALSPLHHDRTDQQVRRLLLP